MTELKTGKIMKEETMKRTSKTENLSTLALHHELADLFDAVRGGDADAGDRVRLYALEKESARRKAIDHKQYRTERRKHRAFRARMREAGDLAFDAVGYKGGDR